MTPAHRKPFLFLHLVWAGILSGTILTSATFFFATPICAAETLPAIEPETPLTAEPPAPPTPEAPPAPPVAEPPAPPATEPPAPPIAEPPAPPSSEPPAPPATETPAATEPPPPATEESIEPPLPEKPTLELDLLDYLEITTDSPGGSSPDNNPDVQIKRARIQIHSTTLEGLRHQWMELHLPVKIPVTDQLMVGNYRYRREGDQNLYLPNSEGEILLKLRLEYSTESFILRRIFGQGQNGKGSRVRIRIKQWHVVQQKLEHRAQKNWNFSVASGLTQARYTQNTTQVMEWLTTVKGMVLYRPDHGKIDSALSFYYTPFGLHYSNPNKTLQFFGANFRIGTKMPWFEEPWRLSILVGAYFAASQSSRAFGFGGVLGPQIYPVITRQLDTSALSAYFKVSPVASSFSLMSLSNRELAMGLNWVATAGKLAGWGFYFDAAELNLSLPSGTASNKTLGLGLSYTF